ncbi:23S rRNA (pseudouridine(1915)-N(3))-methyltransferase RlmH [Oribacterium sp. P6A1]|uniref:23S rRNA (pseudouridine(1915)-N(3))-methyltransferase RlmH n=1 Tax=Oribacterium sp. P6A1 TaxID=1410612 RepID=UPI00055AFD03|nr:23S rRNA (pseudouridine(1915)-N(3))-methyltransferase RlmH [Oribacterium sp. P6A1]
MKVTLVTVGKIKEKYLRDAIAEYSKRLGAFCDINIIEVQDEKTPDRAPLSVEEKIKETEGERILQKISDRSFVVVLAIEGEMLSSEQLAGKISDLMVRGTSDITFVIGGSLGLSPDVLKRANYKLSFSKMTFPHQLMRVILLEQIYRAFKINNNEPYHK